MAYMLVLVSMTLTVTTWFWIETFERLTLLVKFFGLIKLYSVIGKSQLLLQHATKAAASTTPADAVKSRTQFNDSVTDTLASPDIGGLQASAADSRTPPVQMGDIDRDEPVSFHFRHAKQVVSVNAGSIAHDLTLFLPKRNEVFSIHIPHSKQVL